MTKDCSFRVDGGWPNRDGHPVARQLRGALPADEGVRVAGESQEHPQGSVSGQVQRVHG